MATVVAVNRWSGAVILAGEKCIPCPLRKVHNNIQLLDSDEVDCIVTGEDHARLHPRKALPAPESSGTYMVGAGLFLSRPALYSVGTSGRRSGHAADVFSRILAGDAAPCRRWGAARLLHFYMRFDTCRLVVHCLVTSTRTL